MSIQDTINSVDEFNTDYHDIGLFAVPSKSGPETCLRVIDVKTGKVVDDRVLAKTFSGWAYCYLKFVHEKDLYLEVAKKFNVPREEVKTALLKMVYRGEPK